MSSVTSVSSSEPFKMFVCGAVFATGCSTQIVQSNNVSFNQDKCK